MSNNDILKCYPRDFKALLDREKIIKKFITYKSLFDSCRFFVFFHKLYNKLKVKKINGKWLVDGSGVLNMD